LTQRIKELITNWLVEEGFEVKNLGSLPPIQIAWGLDVFTPPPLKVNLKVFKPKGREDRIIILLGVGVSPAHAKKLAKLKPEGRLRFSSKLLGRVLSVCNICNVAIQPNPVEIQAITVALTVFDSRIKEDSKPEFLERITLVVNAFLEIISTFNEEFPTLPEAEGKEESTTTRI